MKFRSRVLALFGFLFLGVGLAACDLIISGGEVDKKTMAGRVWFDEDKDGLQDDGEVGIKDVTVRLVNNGVPTGVEAVTDEEGKYSREFDIDDISQLTVVVELVDPRLDFTQKGVKDEGRGKNSDVDSNGQASYIEMMNIDAGVVEPSSEPEVADEPPEIDDSEGAQEERSPKFLEGSVYYDRDGDGLHSFEAGDEYIPDVDVQLIDAVTKEILQTTTTDDTGRYRFGIEQYDNPVRIRVLSPDALPFSPSAEGDTDQFPSSVDQFGTSIEEIPILPNQRAHAAVYQVESYEIVEEPDDVFRVLCETGEDTEDNPFSGTIFDPSGDGEGTTLEINTPEVPPGVTFCWGIDVAGAGMPTTGPNPNFALEEGNHYSVSACAVNGALAGITAAQTDLNSESIQISTAATASISGGVASLFVPVSDIPSGMTGVRLVVSDLVTCYLSGPLEDNHGYRPPEEFGPGVAQALAAADGTRSCDSANNTCLMIADNLTWERTGDQTVAITIEGVTYAVQFNVLAGTVETRQVDFTDLGWALDLESSTTFETPLRTWQIIQLSANGFPYGYLAVSDNGSSENPFVFAVSILGSDPLSEAALEALAGVINDLAADFRSAFELIE